MKLNVLKLTFEFKYPTIYDYQNLKKFINILSRPNLKINMEDITYHNELISNKYNTYNIYTDLDILKSSVVVYGNINKILKELDNKIVESEKLMYKKDIIK